MKTFLTFMAELQEAAKCKAEEMEDDETEKSSEKDSEDTEDPDDSEDNTEDDEEELEESYSAQYGKDWWLDVDDDGVATATNATSAITYTLKSSVKGEESWEPVKGGSYPPAAVAKKLAAQARKVAIRESAESTVKSRLRNLLSGKGESTPAAAPSGNPTQTVTMLKRAGVVTDANEKQILMALKSGVASMMKEDVRTAVVSLFENLVNTVMGDTTLFSIASKNGGWAVDPDVMIKISAGLEDPAKLTGSKTIRNSVYSIFTNIVALIDSDQKFFNRIKTVMGGKAGEAVAEAVFNDDDDLTTELYDFINNTGDLYNRQYLPIIKNLTLKKAKGVYDTKLAEKRFMYLVETGAKEWAKQNAKVEGTSVPTMPWNKVFSMDVRKRVAKKLTEDFETEHSTGAYAGYLPKKYQVKESAFAALDPDGNLLGLYATRELAEEVSSEIEELPIECGPEEIEEAWIAPDVWDKAKYTIIHNGEKFGVAKSLDEAKAMVEKDAGVKIKWEIEKGPRLTHWFSQQIDNKRYIIEGKSK